MNSREVQVKLAILTTGRQDWGILRSTCMAAARDARFEPLILAGGMHAGELFGLTAQTIRDEGFEIQELMDWVTGHEQDAFEQCGRAVELVGQALTTHAPDALLLVGDRFETAAAALAATLALVPIVHLHGGEETEGAFDNALRHAITKLGHLHLVSHETHARRVLAMGEDPACVKVVGAPALDNLQRADLPNRPELEEFLGVSLEPPVVLVTVHPATLSGETLADAQAVVDAMDEVPATYVITLPNTDPGHASVRAILSRGGDAERRVAVESVGASRYWGLLRVADAMLGNSSSALIEAPAVGLPAVNVGDRQRGRLRGANVIDVPGSKDQVVSALQYALSREFREVAMSSPGPYGAGRSAELILDAIAAWKPTRPPRKTAIPVS